MKILGIILIIAYLSVILYCIFGSAKERTELNNKIVKDKEGNYYKLELKLGDCYFLHKMDTNINF